ncbi:MAG: pyrimidine-nucleoside phosphorylase [Myxococcota bacterium]
MSNRSIQEIIITKRDGGTLSETDIRWVIDQYARGELPDEQMAALAMAVTIRGLDDAESAVWTDAMLRSGDMMDLKSLGPGRVDKHSTGGVGDKVSLILAPTAAACGVIVPMVSGRGLGHTGGTIDKLESIPGYRADLELDGFKAVLAEVGCAIIGQTRNLAPADKRLYALRDVTGTVPSLALIVSSIMSKKLAEDLEGLVLDIKVGGSAWMKTLDDGRELARRMIAVGTRMGVRVIAFLTRMEEPLGRYIGNAYEVAESVATLEGHGPEALVELVTVQAGAMLEIAHGIDADAAQARVTEALASGAAAERFRMMVSRQGGDLAALPVAAAQTVVMAKRAGYVTSIDGLAIAQLGVRLGAGRQTAGEVIDPTIGIRIDALRGAHVEVGDALATILHGKEGPRVTDAATEVADAFVVGDSAPAPVQHILERLDG